MFNPTSQRKQIEDNLLALARKVNTTDSNWLESDAFDKLMNSWRDLAHYYDRSDDRTCGAHVLKLYMRYAVTLRRISEDERVAPRRRQQAKLALKDLNHKLEGMFQRIERTTRTAV